MNIIEGLRMISGRITTVLSYLYRAKCVTAHNDDTVEIVEKKDEKPSNFSAEYKLWMLIEFFEWIFDKKNIEGRMTKVIKVFSAWKSTKKI